MKQLSTLLPIVCLSFRVFGQQETKPKACTNPPAGVMVGGSFNISPEYGCLDTQTTSATFNVLNGTSPSGGHQEKKLVVNKTIAKM